MGLDSGMEKVPVVAVVSAPALEVEVEMEQETRT
jgi:hypothetical protein